MRCVIVLGGELGKYGHVPEKDDFVIACDSGFDNAVLLGITPHLIVGDMDSVKGDYSSTKTLPADSRKDDTDCMLAIKEGLSRGFSEFVLLCGFGGNRTDHLIANIQSLSYITQNGGHAKMCGENEWCTVLNQSTITIQNIDTHSLSVFALGGNAENVTITGCSYPLTNANISPSFPIGVSNFITENTATISVKKGSLLIICSPMPNKH